MFNIARFSAHINNSGTVQTNKFIVRIPPPIILQNGFEVVQRSIEYRANSVKVPGVDLDTQNVSRYGIGPSQKFPTNVNFTDIDINFLDTNGNYIWKYFAKWMNGIFDYTGVSGGSQPSYKVEYKKYYQTDIQIFIFDNAGRQTNAIILKEAFPISLSDVSLSWSENNRLYEFNVRFSFKEWFYSGYDMGVYESGATIGPGQTAQVVPQRTESPREFSSATEASTKGGPRNPADVTAAEVARGNGGASGLQLQPGQTPTGAEQQVVPGPLTWFRNLFR
jgi:hypothetical protein